MALRMTIETRMVSLRFPGISSRCFLRAHLVVAFFVLVFVAIECGSAQEGARIFQTKVKDLLSDSPQVRDDAESLIIGERKMITKELITLIRDKKNWLRHPDSVRRAMHTLGEMRATEGIDVLVEHVIYPLTFELDTAPGLVGGNRLTDKSASELFPAVNALVAIGEPTVDAIVKRIPKTDSWQELAAYSSVLGKLEKRANVRERLDRAVQTAPASRRNGLQRYLQWFDEPDKPLYPYLARPLKK